MMDIKKPLLFVDGSYYIFYRYYATMTWWSKQEENKEKDKGKSMGDPVFAEKYKKMFLSTLTNLMKVHEVPFENVVIAKDCSRCDIWRNDLYKGYKGTRDDKLASFDGRVFERTYSEILPQSGLRVVEYHQLEADDIIAVITQSVMKKNPNADITIITNDNDYIQLLKDYPDLLIINLQGKQIKQRIAGDLDTYLLTKILMGDKSDNIPSIMKSCGPKTAEKLANSPDELLKVFARHPHAKEQFDLNETLIDFHKIPSKLVKGLEESFWQKN